MEGEAGEFHDWEVINNSDTGLVNSSDSVQNLRELEVIEDDSEGMIRSDYFSLHSQKRCLVTVSAGDVSEEGSVDSDNPSWIDPGSETRYQRKNSGEFWSDSSSDRSDSHKFSDFDGKHELGFAENAKRQVSFEGNGEIEAPSETSGEFCSNSCSDQSDSRKFSDLWGKNELCFSENAKSQVGFEGIGEIESQNENLGKVWFDSGGIVSLPVKFEEYEKDGEMGICGLKKMREVSELSGISEGGNGLVVEFGGGDVSSNGCVEGRRGEVLEENENEDGNVAIGEMKSGSKEEMRRVVWWKLPLEFLKYCVFRVSPIWSLSVAAALMGFVILGRRLYRMKRKSRSLPLKVTVDDKKVSQFMNRAARLNEAFSVVRRVPIIRPSVPLAGVTPWPVMSLR